ncbi:tRNA (guanine37-N1)-methyltransferase [Methanohalophilus levihalophilus]|uniref:class I SAM-dependent methyltransferase n=1 Tax=Methanohalophilus levihalophilus TaxID=1431282 RepID=UPI001FD9D36C|nr:class I SAM-dependent methyltransferase family protein [Methanohalophilus levihalophilus]MBP2031174.1 tRNA (guanine37-N1)-methyltransferase [Methanohalophilus levihalophilus]
MHWGDILECLCAKVEKRKGEPVRAILFEQDLLDNSFRISSDDGYLYLPVKSKPDKSILPHPVTFEYRECESQQTQPTLEDMLGYSPSFEIVGEIAIIDAEELEAEKVAVALLKFRPQLKTVLGEGSAIEGEFRVRPMQLIAGEDSTETIHKDHGCLYAVDIAKVYFSPRLSTERQRIADQIGPNDVVVDMFAGVGPYSIPAAKRCRKVYAVDKNPEAVKFLKKNIELNKLDNVEAMVADAHDLPDIFGQIADHVIMNLPHNASDFLEEAVALAKPGGVIHYYAMSHEDSLFEPSLDLIRKAASNAGRSVEVVETRTVRSYAPHQYNICIDARIV